MRRVGILLLVLGVGVISGRMFDGVTDTAAAQQCSNENGDVNGDGMLGLGDAIYLLSHLFNQGPLPVAICQGGTALPDTGQTMCYDQNGPVDCANAACFGQDGFYATGCPSQGRFIDNGDGTVTDTCTGLMWQKEPGNDAVELIWCDALDYCENLDFAGNDDWRLPNVRELESLVDFALIEPAIDPVFSVGPGNQYWSSSSYALNFPDRAWMVDFFGNDIVRNFGKANDFLVRAVRTAQ